MFQIISLVVIFLYRGAVSTATASSLHNNSTNNEEHEFILQLRKRNLQVGTVGRVQKFRFLNAITGSQNGRSLIDPLRDGTVINLSAFASRTFNIEAVADTTNGPVGSIRFSFGGNSNFRKESSSPFAFCGDTNGIYRSCLELTTTGSYTITATPYSLPNLLGVIGQPFTVSFTITDRPPQPIPSPMKPPTKSPVKAPTKTPTKAPTKVPTKSPTKAPFKATTKLPTKAPFKVSTKSPTKAPVKAITKSPTKAPVKAITKSPTKAPFKATTKSPTKTPVKLPTPVLPPVLPAWIEVNPDDIGVTARHEACFVMVGRKAYLLAGRGIKPVNIYNPRTRKWTNGTAPPKEIHHTQCVVVDDSIWIVSSWTGGYPKEKNNEFIYIYNTITNTWSTKPGLPEPRRRGGAAAVLVGRKIYVSHGNRGGHETGNFSTSFGWLDYYDLDADTWHTNLPDAPNPRDHTGGAYVNGRICVAGGRRGGDIGFFNLVVLPTDCYNPITNTWSVEANIPQGRAGASYGRTCDGKLMIAGGEGFGRAWPNVDVFDGRSWTSVDSLNKARHGSGLAVDCVCNQITIASGSARQGNSEIRSVETYFPNGINTPCRS